MKIAAVIAILLGALFMGFQVYTTMSTARTEQQAYIVVEQLGVLEIRHYPQALMATVVLSDTTYHDGSNNGFRRLAGYIFGGNERDEKIAMTAPVRMEKNNGGMRMSFVMPAGRDPSNLPVPQDPGVMIAPNEDQFTAVLRFGGFLNDEVMADKRQQLLEALKTEGLLAIGDVSYLGYNPPWQLVGRRNEVLVPVQWPKR
ncbi:MAG: heme-binding protein [Flavobacteriales bacterium]|nr:heme-binding protein [Flavobacteriales bacterium]